MTFLWILLGLVGIVAGSELALRGAESITRQLGISPLIVGLTLTAVGTSFPEIATNVAAGLSSRAGEDASGLLVGNIVGSCLSQITLLLGLTALAAPLRRPKGFARDGSMMLLAIALMFAACADGYVTPAEGGALIVAYLLYISAIIAIAARTPREEGAEKSSSSRTLQDLVGIVVGLTVVIGSADVVVDQSVLLAREVGISDGVIGLGLGLGTGMPELAVALQSIRRKSADIGLGSLIGSNITDPLLSFGIGASIHVVTVAPAVRWFDFPAWTLASILALLFIWSDRELVRWEAMLLIVFFFAFFVVRAALGL